MQECGVCFDSFPEGDAFFLSACGHSLHQACIAATVLARINAEGETIVKCFEPGCGVQLLDSDIALLSDPSLVARLQRVRAQRSDPSLRFCACGGEVRGGSALSPLLRCGSCGAEFCWLHGARHAPGAAACAAFVAEENRDPANAASLAALRAEGKQCPNEACGSWVTREGGCNSVICAVCQTTFCWLCGQQIAPGELPIHYQWWNLRSKCRFSQFGAARPRTPCQEAALFVATILYGAIFGLPGALLVLAVCLVLPCCCLPVFWREENPLVLFATWSGIASWLLAVLVLVLLALPFALPVGLCFLCLTGAGLITPRTVPREDGPAPAPAAPGPPEGDPLTPAPGQPPASPARLGGVLLLDVEDDPHPDLSRAALSTQESMRLQREAELTQKSA